MSSKSIYDFKKIFHNGFYVYAYIDSNTNLPYYIGKGNHNRAWRKHSNVAIPENDKFIVIISYNLTEIGAYAIERKLIQWYGKISDNTGILLNKASGGEGASGYKHTEEAKQIISEKLKIHTRSNDHCNSISKSLIGRKIPKDVVDKVALKNTGKKRTQEQCKRLSEALIGHMVTEETKMKISESHKGKEKPKGIHSKRSIPILCTTNNTIYYSQPEAAKILGLKQSDINNVLKNRQSHTKGYIFIYCT